MKKVFILFLVCSLILSLSGCSDSVSKEQYDEVCAERDALLSELQTVRDSIQTETSDKMLVRISGDFTATVRHLIPDYVLDGTTPQMAVVTLFQDCPFTLHVGDLAEQLEEGETYVFEIAPKEGVEITAEQYEHGVPFADVAISQYGLRVSGFRVAEESDYGLDADHLVFEKD